MHKVKERSSESFDAIRRAFSEFLLLPAIIIFCFFLLAAGTYLLDTSEDGWLIPGREFLQAHIFASAKATSDLLGAIAAGIISVTSLTITLLLIVVQQSAASMTAQVFDQFLRRKTNQIYFGFFVGLALYSLITLATVNDPFNPVWGGTVALLLTIIALFLLVLLMYTTINQMRPVEIIEAIHQHILTSRNKQLQLINKTRRASSVQSTVFKEVSCTKHGYIARINLELFEQVQNEIKEEWEVVFYVSIGTFVSYDDTFAMVKASNPEHLNRISKAVLKAVHIDRQRDIDLDPAYGIEQLGTIAWTSISTSKSNPTPGLLTIRSLRNILARWSEEPPETDVKTLPVVYTDNTFAALMDTFETLGVVSSESMQHQNFIEVIRSLGLLMHRLPAPIRLRAEDTILRLLSVLGDHVLTNEMETALITLSAKLRSLDMNITAAAVDEARATLAQSVGKLNSRATRVPLKGNGNS